MAQPIQIDATSGAKLRNAIRRCGELRKFARTFVHWIGEIEEDLQQLLAAPQSTGELFAEETPPSMEPELEAPTGLALVSQALGMVGEHQIVRITRTRTEPRKYSIETVSGCIQLGTAKTITDERLFRMKIADQVGRTIPTFKRNADWIKIQQALLDACVDVPDELDASLMKTWIMEYLAARPASGFIDQAGDERTAFLRAGRVCVHLTDLREWIYSAKGRSIPPKEMGILMRRAGAEPTKIAFGKSSRLVWTLPSDPAGDDHSQAPCKARVHRRA
jgi:hypothetical protein